MLHKYAKKQKVCVRTFCAFGLSSFCAVGWRVGPNPLSLQNLETNIPKGKTRSNIYFSVCVYIYIYMLWQEDQSKQLVVRHS